MVVCGPRIWDRDQQSQAEVEGLGVEGHWVTPPRRASLLQIRLAAGEPALAELETPTSHGCHRTVNYVCPQLEDAKGLFAVLNEITYATASHT